jgi:predicted MPP superfamily phosphohydrolase
LALRQVYYLQQKQEDSKALTQDQPVTLVHLSDIHFRKNASTPHDAFKDIRNELERDAVAQKDVLGVYGIVVGGDVAFSGHPNEYEFANTWLKTIAGRLGVDPSERIWVVPGNHDIDRKSVENSLLIQGIHKELRADAKTIDEKLAGYMVKDEEAKKLILKPLQGYNDFAAKFECDIHPGKPFWEDDVILNDGSVLRIRGLNSTIVSDETDSDASHKLILGKRQVEMTRQDGVEYLALCHHPPQWLFDQDSVEDLLKRARIQLFGHKHRERLSRIEDSVRISAGAMHPDVREPNWQPRYNFIQVSVVREGERRVMLVHVYPRVFREDVEGGKFMAETQEGGKEFREFALPLPEWQSPKVAAKAPPVSVGAPTTVAVENPRGTNMRSARKLTYTFLSLPHHRQLAIAQQLGLVRDEDEGVRDSELYRRYFKRAELEHKLEDLWKVVEKVSADLETNRDSTGAA